MTRKKKIVVILSVIVVTLLLAFLGFVIYRQIRWHCDFKSLPERRQNRERGTNETMYAIFLWELIKPGMPYKDIVGMLGEPSETRELLEGKLWCEFDTLDMGSSPHSNVIVFDADKRAEFVPHSVSPGSNELQAIPSRYQP